MVLFVTLSQFLHTEFSTIRPFRGQFLPVYYEPFAQAEGLLGAHLAVQSGGLRDVQALSSHSSLAMTQRYIEIDSRAMEKVVDGW